MKKPIVFMFSGQGSQYFQMGKALYEQHSRFRMWMDHCDELVADHLGESLIDHLYHPANPLTKPFDRLLHSNPALLCIEYSLYRVLLESGLQPDYLLGYSMGEVSCAVVSGALSLEDGMELTIELARCLEQYTPAASLLAILESPTMVDDHPQLFEHCPITCYNFDKNFVVGGEAAAIKQLASALQAKDIMNLTLPVNYGFHTAIIDPAKWHFQQLVAGLSFQPPQLPVISPLCQQPLSQINGAHIWQVLREPVDFATTARRLMAQQDHIFIDVGPSGSLATFIKYLQPAGSASEQYPVMDQFGQNMKTLQRLQRLQSIGG